MEMAIQKRLSKYPVPDFIWEEYHLDQEINDRGISLDMDVVKNAITFDERSKATLSETMQDITGVENPNSVVQMKAWLSENGVKAESLGKKDVTKLIDDTDGQVEEALRLRLQLAKSSVKNTGPCRTLSAKMAEPTACSSSTEPTAPADGQAG